MAAAKTKKRSIIIGNKEYTMPQKMSTMAYLRYLEVRDSIMDTEAKQALYTRQQFMDMMDVIVEMYGNQLPRLPILRKVTMLSICVQHREEKASI